jgi:hypothetical protein
LKHLVFEGEFFYSAEMIPGWTEEERRAVKYGLARAQNQRRPGLFDPLAVGSGQ